jgi:hypothetical protein
MGGIAKQNGTIPEYLGSVSDHLHLCISQLQETVHPIEQQLEQHRIRTFQEEYLSKARERASNFITPWSGKKHPKLPNSR